MEETADSENGGGPSRGPDSPVPERFWRPAFLLSGMVSGIGLACWMVLDFLAVRSPNHPANVHDGERDPLYLGLVAALSLAASYFVAPRLGARSLPARVLASLFATLVGFFGGIALIVTVGIQFHLSIGGQL